MQDRITALLDANGETDQHVHPSHKRSDDGRPGEVIRHISSTLKNEFHIDTNRCNVVEDTLLQLAGIEEKPSKCQYYDPAIFDDSPNCFFYNCLLFRIPLSDDSITLMAQFAKKNNIQFGEFTKTLSRQSQEKNVKLFSLDTEGIEKALLPMILDYLRNHKEVVMRYQTEIVSYMYQKSYRGKSGNVYQEEEYFIPSEEICFNKLIAYKCNQPNNQDLVYFESDTILKKVWIPKSWVEELRTKLDKKESVALNPSDTMNLFREKLMINFNMTNEHLFAAQYISFGSFLLPNYIMKYFEDDKMNVTSLTALVIFKIIQQMDEIEKKSLAACLEKRIADFTAKQIENNKTQPGNFSVSWSTGITAGIAGAAVAYASGSGPAGVFTGSLVLFSSKKHAEHLKRQREEYCNQILCALEMKPKPYATPKKCIL